MGSTNIQHRNNVKISGNVDAAAVLIFVHGFGMDQNCWAQIIPSFTAHYKIITFDNVGAGHADPDAFVQHRYLTLAQYARDLVDICADFNVSNACVIGHSVGGMIATLATLAAPQYFTKLVLLAASPRYIDDQAYVGGFSDSALQETYSAVVANFPSWVSSFAPRAMNNPERPELAQHFADTVRRIKPENALTVLCSILQSDHREDIKKISIPTLILHAQEDYFVPLEVAEYLHHNINNSRLVTINARGHFPHLSAPDEVVRALHAFL